MTTDLIFPIVAGAVAVVLLGLWKTGRAVAVAALSHPLRKNVIYLDSQGTPKISAELPSLNGQEPQATQAKSKDAQEEEEHYTIANR